MNVVCRIQDNNEELEKRFIEEAKQAGLIDVKGHRSVGGLRFSIYNAQTLQAVTTLRDFMQAFEQKYG